MIDEFAVSRKKNSRNKAKHLLLTGVTSAYAKCTIKINLRTLLLIKILIFRKCINIGSG